MRLLDERRRPRAAGRGGGSLNARVAVGHVEVVALTDAEGTFTAFRAVFPDATREQEAHAREAWPELFRGDDWWLPFRCFLVRLRDALVLVDAGVGRQEHFLAEPQARLLDALAEEGVRPHDVDAVLLTHLHVDHVGWTVEGGEPVFGRARYLACGDDLDYFLRARAGSETVVTRIAPLSELESFERFPAVEHEAVPGITAVPAPGHTPGHTVFEVASGGETLVVLGDAAVHPLQIESPGLAYTAEVDADGAARAREALLERVAETEATVALGHFPGSGFGRIARGEAGYGFVV